ncbi:MAG: rhomboid family intramembrane serine protease [Planctomycetaceae bacterium]|nr:rhomboid family intramembrane serine protease [Planctomycetaceae bacterium]
MGFENRDYYRDDDQPPGSFNFRSAPCWQQLIIITVIFFVIQVVFTTPRGQLLENWLAMQTSLVLKGQVWRLFTYCLLHFDPLHLIFNMLILWFVSREVESMYGSAEYLGLYLMGSLVGALATMAIDLSIKDDSVVIGASSSVMTILAIFVFHNPRRLIYLFWGMFAVEARWMLAIIVFIDLIPVIQSINGLQMGGGVANAAHLGGVLYGYLFYKMRWNPLRNVKLPSWKSVKHKVGLGPRLRVVRNEADEDQSLRDEVDTILEKIQREGESSLTKRERKVLIEASKRFKNRT